MGAEIFTDAWAVLWGDKINSNEAYQKAAATWEGSIALVMTEDADMGIPSQRCVVADLWHGACRGTTAGDEGELDAAPYVIRAQPKVWKKVLAGKTDPIVGLTLGKLKLVKGSMVALLPYAKAAKELVSSAMQVETEFPPGW